MRSMNISDGNRGGGRKGFLPEKRTIPLEYSGEKLEDWREWVEDMSDYLDEMEAGMKDFLTDITASEEPADEVFRNKHWHKYNANVLSSGVKLWRTL